MALDDWNARSHQLTMKSVSDIITLRRLPYDNLNPSPHTPDKASRENLDCLSLGGTITYCPQYRDRSCHMLTQKTNVNVHGLYPAALMSQLEKKPPSEDMRSERESGESSESRILETIATGAASLDLLS